MKKKTYKQLSHMSNAVHARTGKMRFALLKHYGLLCTVAALSSAPSLDCADNYAVVGGGVEVSIARFLT